jgi:hypothetical protein
MNDKYIHYTKTKNTQDGGNIGNILNVLHSWHAQKVAMTAEIEAHKTMLNGNKTLSPDVKHELTNMLNLLIKMNNTTKISDIIPATAEMLPHSTPHHTVHHK